MGIVYISEPGGANLERVSKILANIPGGVQRATYQALKRAGETGKTRAGQYAAATYNISKGTFMANVSQKTSISGGAGNVEMRLSYAGKVIPLIKFQSRATRDGLVTARVMRGGSPTTLAHAFVRTIYGENGIWERVGAPRFPVTQLYGPSAAHMMANDTVVEQMDKAISDTYESRLEQEILRLMNGW